MIQRAEVAATGCWLWTGYLHEDGYGLVYLPNPNGGNGKQHRAHRVAYESLVAPIPPGYVIDHVCRVSTCVNPAHLEAVTQQVNMSRGAVNGGALYVPRPRPMLCKRNHVYDEANTYVFPPNTKSKGTVQCRTCVREQRAARKAAAR